MTTSPHRLALATAACAAATGCAGTYHPEYHPQTTYSYVQNVTYARNAWNLSPDGWSDVSAAVHAAAARGDSVDTPCDGGGGALACYEACFHGGRAGACRALGAMFENGDQVFRSPPTAARLYAMACAMGDCASPEASRPPPGGAVTSPGSLVVYGNVYGNVVIGR